MVSDGSIYRTVVSISVFHSVSKFFFTTRKNISSQINKVMNSRYIGEIKAISEELLNCSGTRKPVQTESDI